MGEKEVLDWNGNKALWRELKAYAKIVFVITI